MQSQLPSISVDWPEVSPIKPVNYNKDDDGTSTTISTRSYVGSPSPSPPPPETNSSSVATLLQHSWRQAIQALRTNPRLMTAAILSLALRQRPPLYVVEWMLRLNPHAASVPTTGPTPLMVAVQAQCALPVVEAVLLACPLALVARPPGQRMDPLTHAKKFRSSETDLVELLSRPLCHWMGEKEETKQSKPVRDNYKVTTEPTKQAPASAPERHVLGIVPPSSLRYGRNQATEHPIPSILHRTRPIVTKPPPDKHKTSKTPTAVTPLTPGPRGALTGVERQELDNVKYLCAALLKAHRRQLHHQQQASADQSSSSTTLDEAERQALMKAMDERQQEQARICLIALDMKERAIQGMARRMEERLQALAKSEDPVLTRNLRSSYVHLYKRFLGLEEELHDLKQTALSITTPSTAGAVFCETSVDPLPPERPVTVEYMADDDQDDTRSLLSAESFVYRPRSCLRGPWAVFRS